MSESICFMFDDILILVHIYQLVQPICLNRYVNIDHISINMTNISGPILKYLMIEKYQHFPMSSYILLKGYDQNISTSQEI